MRIEVLYVPGCPNYQPTLDRVKTALASEAVADEVEDVPVSTEAEAKALLFPGSPTVRVNGRDIEHNSNAVPTLACRLYSNGRGVPSQDIIQVAILHAKQRSETCE